MDTTLRSWTKEQFLEWADAQDERYEFDGVQPVAMTGGNVRHSRIVRNLHAALLGCPDEPSWSFFGPDLGIQTVGSTIRYPDALITSAALADMDRLAHDVQIVFEVVSPNSGHMDRHIKAREYSAVPSIRRYVIVETKAAGLIVLSRSAPNELWTAHTCTAADRLDLPEIGQTIPVADLYKGVEFPA